jgi:5-methylcytosine-specific restriction protein B
MGRANGRIEGIYGEPMAEQAAGLNEALKEYDRAAHQQAVNEAEQERLNVVKLFPVESWPDLTLERYALGQDNTHDTFCWLMEFGATHICSMRGGSARKHIIYRHRDGTWFYDQQEYKDENEAWQSLRRGFIDAFAKAKAGDWKGIDEISVISGGGALRTKTLYCYFPEQLIPVTSIAHIRHYLRLLGNEEAPASGHDVVQLNRQLLQTLRKISAFEGWKNWEIARFLYHWADPRDQKQIVKIAPGENAEFWKDCLRDGCIYVGWDDIGDLRQFESEESFRAAFNERCGHVHKNNKATLTRKSKELWKLRELEPGDRIVANMGTSKVLAVGEVLEPGYEWHDERQKFRHGVRVKWDTSFEQEITEQKKWAFATVAPVSQALATEILDRKGGGGNGAGKVAKAGAASKAVPVDPILHEIAGALERKGQVILYGPPGTGKTYTARRFAVWWLKKQMGDESPQLLADPATFIKAEQELKDGPLTCLTFHASYSYEDFIEGFRPVDNDSGSLVLRLEHGIFRRICDKAQANPKQNYLVLIDEINRANVAKVLGELITLLEKDKRGLMIDLPQSKDSFTIPSNVFLLGTMNTADRSIKLLDAAMRRRFAFIELMPDPSLLSGGKVGNLALDDFLIELNRRIAAKAGREKQIGHSFLLDKDGPVVEPEEFARRFRQEILPLLQEYCYEDYRVLATYIGDKLVDRDGQMLDDERLADPDKLIEALEESFITGAASE